MSKMERIYKNGVLVNNGNNSSIFVDMDYKEKSDGREMVKLVCSRFWNERLTKKVKKRYHFTRDFFGRTYTLVVITFGKDIFEQMCDTVMFKDSTTFTWDEKNKTND